MGELAVPWKSLSAAAPGPRRWTVEDFIVAGKLNTLFGKGGLGKGFIVAAMAVCVATGQPFLGRRVEEGLVYWLDYETDVDEFSRILYRVSAALDVPPPVGRFRYFDPDCPLPQLLERLRHDFEIEKPALVVDDSVGASLLGIRTQAEETITELLTGLKSTGRTWMLIDHTAKDEGARTPFGSGYKEYLARNAWLIKKGVVNSSSLEVILERTKSNFRTARVQVGLRLDFEGEPDVGPVRLTEVGYVREGRMLTNAEAALLGCLSEREDEALTALELAELSGKSLGNVQNILSKLKKKGRADSMKREGRREHVWWRIRQLKAA